MNKPIRFEEIDVVVVVIIIIIIITIIIIIIIIIIIAIILEYQLLRQLAMEILEKKSFSFKIRE